MGLSEKDAWAQSQYAFRRTADNTLEYELEPGMWSTHPDEYTRTYDEKIKSTVASLDRSIGYNNKGTHIGMDNKEAAEACVALVGPHPNHTLGIRLLGNTYYVELDRICN